MAQAQGHVEDAATPDAGRPAGGSADHLDAARTDLLDGERVESPLISSEHHSVAGEARAVDEGGRRVGSLEPAVERVPDGQGPEGSHVRLGDPT